MKLLNIIFCILNPTFYTVFGVLLLKSAIRANANQQTRCLMS